MTLCPTCPTLPHFAPLCPTCCLSRHEPTRTLRSTSKVLLRVPTPREARRWQQGRGPFQWWPPDYGMISPKRLAWCQHCYPFGTRSRPTSSPRQLTTCVEFVLLLVDPRIVVLICIHLFVCFYGFKFCILVFNVYCF